MIFDVDQEAVITIIAPDKESLVRFLRDSIGHKPSITVDMKFTLDEDKGDL